MRREREEAMTTTAHVFVDYLSVDCYLAFDEILATAAAFRVALDFHPFKLQTAAVRIWDCADQNILITLTKPKP